MDILTDIPESVLQLSKEFEPIIQEQATDNSVPNIDGLNKKQREAFDEMVAYISGKREYNALLLEGYAGVGKTHVIVQLIKYIIMMQHNEIAITAPTNKAVKVLRKTARYKHNLLTFKTVHSLLGLKQEVDEDGKVSFVRDMDPENNNKISDISVLIVDETSMFPDELFEFIWEEQGQRTENDPLYIIFMGDPCQIPPVGKIDCIPFIEAKRQRYGIHRIVLDEIVRQKDGNPILEFATIIRNNLKAESLPWPYHTAMTEQGGIIMINADDKDRLFEVCEHYFTNPRFQHDADFMKVIAWTNVAVDWMNARIRRMIFPDLWAEILKRAERESKETGKPVKPAELPRVIVGEKLIADKPILGEPDPISRRPKILFNTNDEFDIESFTLEEVNVFENFRVSVYRVVATEINDEGKVVRKTFDIVHESGDDNLLHVLRVLKDRAIKMKRDRQFDEAKKAWRFYYSIENKFGKVKYNYAITSHKSQGSTYDNCIMIETDIDKNGAPYNQDEAIRPITAKRQAKVIERNRIKYVASTRARNLLFIVK